MTLPTRNSRIQDYLQLHTPCPHAVIMNCHTLWTRVAAIPMGPGIIMRSRSETITTTVRGKTITPEDKLTAFARFMHQYAVHLENTYDDETMGRFELLTKTRGVPIVSRPTIVQRGNWFICIDQSDHGHLRGEQFLRLTIHDEDTITIFSDPFGSDYCLGHLLAVEHVLGHWEVLHFETHPFHRRQGVATFMLDALTTLLPGPADRGTLPDGFPYPAPGGLLTSDGLGVWKRRAPHLAELFEWDDRIGLWMSPRQHELICMAVRHAYLDHIEPDLGVPMQ